ncbi:tetratricopeptide repeat protein [Sphingomonas abietis]|uniref:Tetratricopeptide repeat protein n=1 Tax=Sphingomonas abietis TaxID=3012344 RepID=A0ABY7NQ75_9SPHN|nr:tetratricopeptide repeat protein [Sphingomonas abietis]WBO22621.1 tetratricopeptide repeat protein [Sphingomonas abietis]
MILLALLLAAAPTPSTGPADFRSSEVRFGDCVRQSDLDPAAAQQTAIAWAKSGGGVPAAQCLGIARSAAENWAGAVDAFTTAANLADQTHQPVAAANLWVSVGNAALAGGDPAKAREALTTAIASPALSDPLKGEAYLDRARAAVAANDDPAARVDLDQAVKLVPADPMAWLLSATLARRMNDPTRAATDIKEAMTRAPNQADILYEAGNIAGAAGDMSGAREQWTRAATAEPGSDASKRARAELAATGAPLPPQPAKSLPSGR